MEHGEGEIRLIEPSPGHSLISIASLRNDRPPMQMLVEALEAWRSKFPTRLIADLEVIRLRGIPNLLSIQWQESNRSPFLFDVLESVRQRYGQEYVEALAEDALGFIERNPHEFPVAAMISKREVVLVIVKRKNKCCIGMLSDFLPLLHPKLAADIANRFETFQHSSETGYGIVPLPDNFDISSK
jgi:hypothetical protein